MQSIVFDISFFLRVLLSPLLYCSWLNASYSQKTDVCEQALMIVKTVENFHYQPRIVNDEFSETVFSGFITYLDPYSLYLTNAEIEHLEKYRYALDEEILEQKCSFIQRATELYQQRLIFTDSLIDSFKTREFDYDHTDTLTIIGKNKYLNQEQLTDHWVKLFKFNVLSNFFSNPDSAGASLKPSREQLIRLKNNAITRESCAIKSKINYQGGLAEFVGIHFLKAVASAFDPHTNYFTQSDEQVFSSLLSKETESFGFGLLRNNFGEIEISQIIPGSPSWNSNALNIGDVILRVETAGLEKDFDCITMHEVVDFLTSEEIVRAEFFIRKKNGNEINLTLFKSKIDVQENAIKSFILEGEEKIGYIYLPAFYSQTDNYTYSNNGCANDLAKELIKLKTEHITGLIIDLRNNRGGSMMEAILIAGIFMDYGAMGIVQTKNNPPITLKDMNRGTIYSDPLLVLINNFSASASELFAAAMQDLNRAVIVGSNSFGKSTIQEVLPINAYKYNKTEYHNYNPDSYIKLTRGAFFRVTGKSIQKVGVIPDIKLPSVYDEIDLGERFYQSAIDSLSTDKKVYYYPLTPLPIQKLNEQSNNRVKKDSIFNLAINISKLLSDERKQSSFPLSTEAIKTFKCAYKTKELPNKQQSAFIVKSPGYHKGLSSMIKANKVSNEAKRMQIQTDIYIWESYNIINDLIKLNKK